jgi:hypothetical protein
MLKIFVDKEGFIIVPVNQDGLKTVVGNLEVVNDNCCVNAEGKKMVIGYERTIFTIEVKKNTTEEIDIVITITDDKMRITYQTKGSQAKEVEINREIGEGMRIGPIELTIEMVFGEMWTW